LQSTQGKEPLWFLFAFSIRENIEKKRTQAVFPATSLFVMESMSLASTGRAKPHEKSPQEHKSKGFLGLLLLHESKNFKEESL